MSSLEIALEADLHSFRHPYDPVVVKLCPIMGLVYRHIPLLPQM